MAPKVYTSSRFSEGNLIFPSRIEIWPDKIVRIRPRLVGLDVKTLRMDQIASVQVHVGPLSAIRVESKGGDFLASRGHSASEVDEMRDLIERGRSGGLGEGSDGVSK